MEPLARKLQSVGVSVPSVKSLIAFLQSVLDQDRVDFNTVASSIYDEACAVRSSWHETAFSASGCWNPSSS